MDNGIAIAGNMLVDYVKLIPSLPAAGMLASILSVDRAVGGSVPNTLLDLAAMGGDIPLTAIGLMGKDEAGDYVQSTLEKAGIDTRLVQRTQKTATSFSDAMCARDTGERTFFHFRGANARFSPEHIPLDRIHARILHIGYLLLLDRFDAEDPEYGTVMARFLHDAQAAGFLTSIDVVSDSEGRFAQVVKPALKYCDYVIVNEIEACAVWGLSPRDENGSVSEENIRAALTLFKQSGVKRRAVVHCPEAGYCLDEDGMFTKVSSLRLPDGYIKGSVGAGDAFCAGCLRAIYRGKDASEMLTLAAAAAAANLSAADSVSGMKDEAALYQLDALYRKAQ